MKKQFLIGLMIAALCVLGVACSNSTESNTNTNANSNAGDTASTTADSEVASNTDSNGVKTETRTFKDNPRVSKVVVTTENGNRTVKAYSPSGEEKDVSKNEPPPDALHATGDAIADSAGWVKDKSKTAYDKAKEGTKTAADKTVDTSKKVADKTADTGKAVYNKSKPVAKKVGDKSVDVTKTVVDATKEGAKTAGKTIKKIIPPQ